MASREARSRQQHLTPEQTNTIVELVVSELCAAIPYFASFPDVCREAGVAAAEAEVEVAAVTVRHCRRGVAFTDFLIIYASSQWRVRGEKCGRTRRERGGGAASPSSYISTMHFLPREFLNCDASAIIAGPGFQLQSVVALGEPFRLECYPRHMVHFGFGIAAAAHLWGAASKTEWARPSALVSAVALPAGRVIVLGMGANVLAQCLACALPESNVVVVEVEQAVVDICSAEGLCPEAHSGHRVETIVGDACAVLPILPRDAGLIFLDCFDPLAATMMCAVRLLQLCHDALRPGGAVIVNAHLKCDTASADIAPFVQVFGDNCVHVGKVREHDQVIVVCLKRQPGSAVAAARHGGVKQLRAAIVAVNQARLLGNLALDPNIAYASRTAMVLPDGDVASGGQCWRLWLTA